MELMQVYDCYEMPFDVREAFFESASGYSNDCYISWWIEPEEADDEDGLVNAVYHPVTKWLMDQGAVFGSRVLISHSW